MYRIWMDLTISQLEELSEHLIMNGYACREDWLTDDCLEVGEEELYEVITILRDRGIKYEVYG